MPAYGLIGFAPVGVVLTTTLANFGPAVLTGRERVLKVLRATNGTSTDQSVTVTVKGFLIANNFLVAANSAIDLIDDNFGPLDATTQLQARASAASAITLLMLGMDRTIS